MLCHAWNTFACFWIKQATERLHFMTAVNFLSTVPCPTSFYCCQYSPLFWLNCQFWKVIDNTLDSGRVELASTWEINVNRPALWDSAQPRGNGWCRHGFRTHKQILHIKNGHASLLRRKNVRFLEKIISQEKKNKNNPKGQTNTETVYRLIFWPLCQ